MAFYNLYTFYFFSLETFSITVKDYTKNIPVLNDVIFPITTSISICLWVRPANDTLRGEMYALYTPSIENFFGSYKSGDDQLTFDYKGNGQVYHTYQDTWEKKWNHLCVSYNHDGIDLYVNGTLANSNTGFTLNLRKSYNIMLALGNDIDYGSVNDASQSFLGEYTQFFILNKKITPHYAALAFDNNMDAIGGIIVRWIDFKDKVHGNEANLTAFPFNY